MSVTRNQEGLVCVRYGNGDGTLRPMTSYATGATSVWTSAAVADLNGDARPDIVASNVSDNTVSVLMNRDTDAVVRRGLHALAVAIQNYAVDNNDIYPTVDMVSVSSNALTLADGWPMSPYSGLPMASGTHAGDYQYVLTGGGTGFTLTGYLASGGPVTYP